MSKLYVNENFPLPVVKLLRNLVHDVLTSFDAGNANQRIPDDEVLRFAVSQNRILLTINRRDFILLHNQNPIHAGILACTQNADFEKFALNIHKELLKNEGNLENQLLKIYK
jgi:predicted nuclease of predicted toxin-antitoxin system